MSGLVRRTVLHVVAVLFLVSIGLAFLLELTPGDPAYAVLGAEATPEQVAQVHADLHLDDSLVSRYGHWVGNVLRFDFGRSYLSKQPVTRILLDRVPVTAELIVLAMVMALCVAIPIGIYTAYRADSRFDRIWAVSSSALISFPPFVSALVLVYVLAVLLRDFPLRFPASGWTYLSGSVGDNLWHAALPALTLALVEVPALSRVLRADMIATLQEDFILAARARGVPDRRILLRHALRPSSFSLMTLAGLSLARLIGGAVIVESLFALPGLGQLLVQSILSKDVIVVQGLAMFIAILYVVLNAALDVGYRVLDPRIRSTTAP